MKLDQAIIDACVERQRYCHVHAKSRFKKKHRPSNKGRDTAIENSPDEILARHGIIFAEDPLLWCAYTAAIFEKARRVA